jgi:Uma2 family endonuclease
MNLVLDIRSPGPSKMEMGIKIDLYSENRVKGICIIEPGEKLSYRYVLQNGNFIGWRPCTADDEVRFILFPKLKFPLKILFDEKGIRRKE